MGDDWKKKKGKRRCEGRTSGPILGFILIPAVSLLRASVVQHCRGGERRDGASVEGENEEALALFPGDPWS